MSTCTEPRPRRKPKRCVPRAASVPPNPIKSAPTGEQLVEPLPAIRSPWCWNTSPQEILFGLHLASCQFLFARESNIRSQQGLPTHESQPRRAPCHAVCAHCLSSSLLWCRQTDPKIAQLGLADTAPKPPVSQNLVFPLSPKHWPLKSHVLWLQSLCVAYRCLRGL